MELTGEKIALKSYTLERCHEFYKDYISDPAMTYDNYVYNKERVDRYYQNKVLDAERRFFAICYNNKVIGEIQLKRIDFEKLYGTLSIHLVNDTVKGRGFGTEAERLLIEYAINELGLHTIYADTIHRNYRSKHILEKLGFEHIYDDDVLAYYKYSAK
ncbi:GNAT family N-acetyltransferase [Proteiniborus sp. MB09-C3]|uniref:GNAT family N-acetyltransferase n=1 Tax=Proteiniborus sp. MB09-C3 TaxID=3050072 RepID=UPI002555E762|nr:GNAT family N-acetyltransferase [Proteiniborus sp. MB09-C3]WIV12705.1 GNAT family N-acetyltransferase [Proteiniborus sp. MB09-C3]